MHIVIIEDEQEIRQELSQLLRDALYDVTAMESFENPSERVLELQPDLILLDLNLPGISGFDICAEIRRNSEVPIIFVTSRTDAMDELTGIVKGGDDYITKPFSLKLVLMRIEAVLRRFKEKSEKQKVLSAQGIELHVDSYEVYKDNIPVNLTRLEFELLQTFLNHKNQVLTRDILIQQVWGYDFMGDEKTVNIHIMNLRRKLNTECIHTIRGVGYKLESEH